MSRLSFYRKYRSSNFNEIVGQEHILQTLSNAINNNSLSHAYIFSGPRGTGKTSCARILAKAVNQFHIDQQFDTLTSELCQRITHGTCVDIVEIDAASNTGVDNIRDLNDKVNFTPVECTYKFYIIDEVHMLSTGAFNALLKTLEEPPVNTIFILATTEPHKIPITIHSRCQHLRFRNLSDTELMSQLQYVCEKEAITLSQNACAILAKNASGCMRDALSLLDQMVSFKGKTIEDTDVIKVLGTCDHSVIETIINAIYTQNTSTLLETLKTTAQSGINPSQLINDLINTVDAIMAIQSNCEHLVLHHLDSTKALATISTLTQSTQLLHTLAEIESESRWFSNPALLLQIKLMQHISTPTTQTQAATTPPITAPTKPITEKPKTNPVPTPTITPTPPTPKPAPTATKKPDPTPAPTQSQPSQSQWGPLLQSIKTESPGLFTILRGSQLHEITDTKISIKLSQPIQFFVEKLNEPSYKKDLETRLKTVFNKPLTFSIINMKASAEELSPSETSPEAPASSTETTPNSEEKSINDIVQLFEGKVL